MKLSKHEARSLLLNLYPPLPVDHPYATQRNLTQFEIDTGDLRLFVTASEEFYKPEHNSEYLDKGFVSSFAERSVSASDDLSDAGINEYADGNPVFTVPGVLMPNTNANGEIISIVLQNPGAETSVDEEGNKTYAAPKYVFPTNRYPNSVEGKTGTYSIRGTLETANTVFITEGVYKQLAILESCRHDDLMANTAVIHINGVSGWKNLCDFQTDIGHLLHGKDVRICLDAPEYNDLVSEEEARSSAETASAGLTKAKAERAVEAAVRAWQANPYKNISKETAKLAIRILNLGIIPKICLWDGHKGIDDFLMDGNTLQDLDYVQDLKSFIGKRIKGIGSINYGHLGGKICAIDHKFRPQSELKIGLQMFEKQEGLTVDETTVMIGFSKIIQNPSIPAGADSGGYDSHVTLNDLPKLLPGTGDRKPFNAWLTLMQSTYPNQWETMINIAANIAQGGARMGLNVICHGKVKGCGKSSYLRGVALSVGSAVIAMDGAEALFSTKEQLTLEHKRLLLLDDYDLPPGKVGMEHNTTIKRHLTSGELSSQVMYGSARTIQLNFDMITTTNRINSWVPETDSERRFILCESVQKTIRSRFPGNELDCIQGLFDSSFTVKNAQNTDWARSIREGLQVWDIPKDFGFDFTDSEHNKIKVDNKLESIEAYHPTVYDYICFGRLPHHLAGRKMVSIAELCDAANVRVRGADVKRIRQVCDSALVDANWIAGSHKTGWLSFDYKPDGIKSEQDGPALYSRSMSKHKDDATTWDDEQLADILGIVPCNHKPDLDAEKVDDPQLNEIYSK